jgi:hypothetical protein
MESLTSWLASPTGIEFEHAVILLIVAIAGYLNWLTHQQTADNAKKLNGHLEEHMIGTAHTTESVVDDSAHNM